MNIYSHVTASLASHIWRKNKSCNVEVQFQLFFLYHYHVCPSQQKHGRKQFTAGMGVMCLWEVQPPSPAQSKGAWRKIHIANIKLKFKSGIKYLDTEVISFTLLYSVSTDLVKSVRYTLGLSHGKHETRAALRLRVNFLPPLQHILISCV